MNEILKFPESFLWGSATSAHQIEGGIKNDWWVWAHKKSPIFILGRKIDIPKAGKACDHYNRYEEDFDLVKSLNQGAHRFSIEWARLEPEEGKFNLEELRHYTAVIQALKSRSIIPFVTLHHFTNPIWFHKKGSWLNENSPDYFKRYVEFVVKNLEEKVRFWITINELDSYAGWYPPLRRAFLGSRWPDPLDMLRAMKNLIKAHKEAYRVLHKFGSQNVEVGIATNNTYFDGSPKILVRLINWFSNKLLLNLIKNHQDFIGLNYYFHSRIKPGFKNPKKWFFQNVNKKISDIGWEIYPEGIYHVLTDLKKYHKPIYILENGLADAKDNQRADFIKEHLYWIHKAITEKNVDVRGYFYWSLIDNFEFAWPLTDGFGRERGFSPKFGLIEIDFRTLERKPRPSAFYYAQICKNNGFTILKCRG